MSEETPGLVERARGYAARGYAALSAVDEESDQARRAGGWRVDAHALALVVLVSALLSAQEYYGASSHYGLVERALSAIFGAEGRAWFDEHFRRADNARLYRLGYWVAATVTCYLVVPALWVKLVWRGKLSDYGFRLRGVLSHAWIYVVIFGAIFPVLVVASTTQSFQRMYPFYQQAGRSWEELLAWELMYALQFMSLEFFFRGFMIQGLRPRFGAASILVAVIPYCMIHFGKPLPETLGAIFAGLALGVLALLTRSIWMGVAIHVSVAVSMDLLSLWMKGELG
jgi:membrane protease YdiL (CAAX protease family)